MKKILFGLPTLLVLALVVALSDGHWPPRVSKAVAAGRIWTERDAKEKATSGIDPNLLNKAFVELAKNLSPAVVNVYTTVKIGGGGRGGRRGGPGAMNQEDLFKFFFGSPFGQQPDVPREQNSLGSGFVINADGYILTNSHVVTLEGKKADEIMVKFLDDPVQGKGQAAEVLGVDESTDIAVIKLKKNRKNIKVAPLGNSDNLQVGEWVMAIGNPFGHTHSVTTGIVSAMGREIDPQLRANFIQTDASINPGNSGGPLLNLYGEVIGINTAIDARGAGIGFAIPINTVKSIVTQIVEKGEVVRGWIGVTIGELTPEVASELKVKTAGGAIIQQVLPGEPADKAGVKPYDVVTEINGKPVATSRDFLIMVGNLNVGEVANMKLVREGKELKIAVKAGKRRSDKDIAKRYNKDQDDDDQAMAPSKSGLSVTDLSPELRKQLEVEKGVEGVVVRGVAPDSPAAQAGIAPGDVIEEINRKKVVNARTARKLLDTGKNLLLKVARGSASVIVMIEQN